MLGIGPFDTDSSEGSGEDTASWSTLGYVSETYYTDGWVEECDDENDDGYEDDWEWAKSNGNGRWGTPYSGYFSSFAGSNSSEDL